MRNSDLQDKPQEMLDKLQHLDDNLEVAAKRKVIVVLEMELEDFEDAYDTASMAVGLLNSNMDNNITLITAADKHDG